jgi:hypothetical protein
MGVEDLLEILMFDDTTTGVGGIGKSEIAYQVRRLRGLGPKR